MIMTFIDSKKGTFLCQSGHLGRHRRPWRHTFFFLQNFFTWCLVKILPNILKNFWWLRKWGLWSGKRREYQQLQLRTTQGHQGFPWRTLLLRQRTFPKTPSLREKTARPPGNNKKLFFKGSGWNMCEKIKPSSWGSRSLGGRVVLYKSTPSTGRLFSRVYKFTYSYRGGGGGDWTRQKVIGATVHKAGSKIPTWPTVTPVYKLW